MPHSLRVKLRGLERNNILKKREADRIIEALDYFENESMIDNLRITAEKLGYKLVKNKPYERMLPCTCGCKQREHWRCFNPGDGNPNIIVCKKCGKMASGKSKAEAKRNWNKMIKEENHVSRNL